MNSRVSWSVDGIDPSVRERAEAAARRAGMSLNDWLNSTLGETAPQNFRGPYDPRQDQRQVRSTSGSTSRSARSADAEPGIRSGTESGEPRRRRHPSAARRDHPADRTDFKARSTAPGRFTTGRFSRRLARAGRRPPAQRRDLAARCPPVADLAAPQPHSAAASSAAARAGRDAPAPGRSGRACGRASLSQLTSPEPRVVRRRGCRDHRTAERARRLRTASAAAARRTVDRALGGSLCSANGAACACLCSAAATAAAGAGFLVARTPSAQDHEPDRVAAAS